MFLTADGEAGKRFGNETIRVTPEGLVTIKLPAAPAYLANAPRGRYQLAVPVRFSYRRGEGADRVHANRAVAYTVTFDPEHSRWYLTAAWQPAPVPQVTLGQAIAGGCIGVDTNDDHYAVWLLDPDGNPIGGPKRFGYDMAGTCDHRDAQIRHATSRLLRWAAGVGVETIAFENLDFSDGKTREKHGRRCPFTGGLASSQVTAPRASSDTLGDSHRRRSEVPVNGHGRRKQFRRLISRFPNARLRARLVSMAAEQGIAIVAVDPAYTSGRPALAAAHVQQDTQDHPA
jgi:hypothetical protein